jgi:PPOX class probable F420-dependent enzyme
MKPTVEVPESHRDLLARPIQGVLATMGPAGFPRARPAWCTFDGAHVLVPTTLESAEAREVAARAVATVLVVDPDDGSRWIEVRGHAELTREGAAELADGLARLYTAHARHCSGVLPAEQQDGETPVVCRIRPTRVNLDAIHR